MKKNIFVNLVITIVMMIVCGTTFVYAKPNTFTNGLDFNMKIKLQVDKNMTSASIDKTITGFKRSYDLPSEKEKLFDISEDADGTVIAYIDDNDILYYYCDNDTVYLNEDMSYMFDKCVNLHRTDFSELCFKNFKKADFMFANCRNLQDINFDNDEDIKLTNMQGMFFDCESLIDLKLFMVNTKNVESMKQLFYNCKNLKNIEVSEGNWNIKKVVDFTDMWTGCNSLKTNRGKFVKDIKDDEYKKYTICGNDDDEIEGLLKDVDYEYSDYGKKQKFIKVANLDDKIISTIDNKNTDDNIDDEKIKKAQETSKVNIATDSELFDFYNDIDVKKESSSKYYIDGQDKANTDDLILETTYVDKLVIKLKKSTKSEAIKIIEPEETYVATGSETATSSQVKKRRQKNENIVYYDEKD